MIRSFRFAPILGAALIAVAGCVPQPAEPPVAPPPLPRPTPAPSPVAPPPSADWRDWPATPGDWRWTPAPGGSVARFGAVGAPLLTLACDRAARQMRLIRSGGGTVPLTVRTSTDSRTLPVTPTADGATATLPAADPLLEAMGFSRGRFVVEQAGQPTLVVPAWAEVERVTEDCRG